MLFKKAGEPLDWMDLVERPLSGRAVYLNMSLFLGASSHVSIYDHWSHHGSVVSPQSRAIYEEQMIEEEQRL